MREEKKNDGVSLPPRNWMIAIEVIEAFPGPKNFNHTVN